MTDVSLYRSVRAGVTAGIALLVALSAGAAPGGGASGGHSILLLPDGTVWTSGTNNNGELGDGTNVTRLVRVQVLSGGTAVDTGSQHTVALVNGTALVWGHNGYGQHCTVDPPYNTGSYPTPHPIAGGVVQVAATHLSTFLLFGNGTIQGCGSRLNGVLGDGVTSGWRAVPQTVSGVSDAVAISGGQSHVLALRANGDGGGMGRQRLRAVGRCQHDRPFDPRGRVRPDERDGGLGRSGVQPGPRHHRPRLGVGR